MADSQLSTIATTDLVHVSSNGVEHQAAVQLIINQAKTSLSLGTASTHAATDFLTPSGSGASLTGLTGGQFTGAPVAVTGSKGSGAALVSLLAALVTLGFITDSTVA